VAGVVSRSPSTLYTATILTSPRPRLPEQVRWELLTDERLELAVPPGHRLAARRRIRLAEVAAEPFVALAVTAEFREAGFSPAVAFEADVARVRALVGAVTPTGSGQARPAQPVRPLAR
jgi:DNA-binding transcriptional LysR family regulator